METSKSSGFALIDADALENLLKENDNENKPFGLAFKFTGRDLMGGNDHSAEIAIYTIFEELPPKKGYYYIEKYIFKHTPLYGYSYDKGNMKISLIQYEWNDLLDIIHPPYNTKFCFFFMLRKSIETIINNNKGKQLMLKAMPGYNQKPPYSQYFTFTLSAFPLGQGQDGGIPCPPIWTGNVPNQHISTTLYKASKNDLSNKEAIFESISQYMSGPTKQFFKDNMDEILANLDYLYNNMC